MRHNADSHTRPARSGQSRQSGAPIRLLLVDDQPRVRQGWRMRLALEADIEVVGEAGDGRAALRAADALHPDAILMDVEMAGMDGVTTTRELCAAHPGCKVIIVTIHDTEAMRRDALAAGASDFVSKQEPFDALLAAIRRTVG
ncbi:MAG: response regulator transcription factor [Chloroflexi bacterium]|nr:response regulator transcription factor [Chloroflexota bacterium]